MRPRREGLVTAGLAGREESGWFLEPGCCSLQRSGCREGNHGEDGGCGQEGQREGGRQGACLGG